LQVFFRRNKAARVLGKALRQDAMPPAVMLY
jgi:hypothetical protein